eukprot:64287_1
MYQHDGHNHNLLINYTIISRGILDSVFLILRCYISTAHPITHQNSPTMAVGVYVDYLKRLIRAPLIATCLFFLFHPAYNSLYEKYGPLMSAETMMSFLLWSSHMACYWGVNTFFFICDHYGYLQKYKLPRKKHQIPSTKLVWKSVVKQLLQMITAGPIFVYYVVTPVWLRIGNPVLMYDTTECLEFMVVVLFASDISSSSIVWVSQTASRVQW